jgi:hypothetical protein
MALPRRSFLCWVTGSSAAASAESHTRLDRTNLLLYRDRGGKVQPVKTVESSELIRQVLCSESFWKPATVCHPAPVDSPRAPTIREPRRRKDCK